VLVHVGLRLVVSTLLLGASACGGVSAYGSSTFEAGDDAWLIGNNGGTGTRPPTLQNQGANPSGCICGTDAEPNDIWYFWAPSEFLGNAAKVYGKKLTFDLREGQSFYQIHGRDVVLNGGGLALSYTLPATPGQDWSPQTVWINDQVGWLLDDQSAHPPPATAEQIRTVLGSLTSLRIRGEYSSSSGNTSCLDNVYFGRD
jgi:hypothetical protein